MTVESYAALARDAGVVPLVDTTLLPEGPGEPAVVRAAHRWYEHLIALWAPGVIEAAHDLGLFDALSGAPMTSAEVAEAVHADHRATRVLLNALYAYDMLERGRNADGAPVYVLPGDIRGCLLPGGLFSLAGKIGYDRRLAWESWRNLTAAVQSGSCDADGSERGNQISADEYELLVRGINFWAPPIVDVLANTLDGMGWRTTGHRARMLDVGCGSGVYGQLLARRFRRLSVTGLDVERITPIAEQQAASLGVANQFDVRPCDFFACGWGTGFDLVFFANIFHLQTPDSARILVAKAADALAENGLIAIVDHIVDDGAAVQSTQDRFFRLFAASMLATGGGDTYTIDDYTVWLGHSGLRPLTLLDTPMHRILIAARG